MTSKDGYRRLAFAMCRQALRERDFAFARSSTGRLALAVIDNRLMEEMFMRRQPFPVRRYIRIKQIDDNEKRRRAEMEVTEK